MIQRIQTLFLFLSVVLSFVLIFTPISNIRLASGETLKLYSYGLNDLGKAYWIINNIIPLLTLLSIATIFSFICIFLYKKRILQMKICIFNIILLIVVSGLIYFDYTAIQKKYEIVSPSFYYIVLFPVLNILTLFIAYRAIRKDEHLVKSYERLR
jgi:hypothetical protein